MSKIQITLILNCDCFADIKFEFRKGFDPYLSWCIAF